MSSILDIQRACLSDDAPEGTFWRVNKALLISSFFYDVLLLFFWAIGRDEYTETWRHPDINRALGTLHTLVGIDILISGFHACLTIWTASHPATFDNLHRLNRLTYHLDGLFLGLTQLGLLYSAVRYNIPHLKIHSHKKKDKESAPRSLGERTLGRAAFPLAVIVTVARILCTVTIRSTALGYVNSVNCYDLLYLVVGDHALTLLQNALGAVAGVPFYSDNDSSKVNVYIVIAVAFLNAAWSSTSVFSLVNGYWLMIMTDFLFSRLPTLMTVRWYGTITMDFDWEKKYRRVRDQKRESTLPRERAPTKE